MKIVSIEVTMDSQAAQGNSAEKPNCLRCQYYFITWEPKAPKGCRAHGFKSVEFPHQVVMKSSGIPCQLFISKPEKKS